MNSFNLYLECLNNGKFLTKDGIVFSDRVLVRLLVDGEEIDEIEEFKDSLIVLEELVASKKCTGNYLIFTCACGIAEDGGWDGVRVFIGDDFVRWQFEVGVKILSYVFDRCQYNTEIDSISEQMKHCTLSLEPTSVIFPTSFRRGTV